MTRIEIQTPSGTAWADLDRPGGDSRALLVLGHGAGGGVETPDLKAIRDAAVDAQFLVARVTQPYRVLGRRAPAPAPRLDEAWAAIVAALRRRPGLRALPLFTGGRSSGARVACRTSNATGATGVIALAFPLHPPGKPHLSRLDELMLPSAPVLLVQGDRDAFGMPPQPEPGARLVIEGADHSLKKNTALTAAAVVEFVRELT